MWQRKGKFMVLKKFFDELDDWFYLYYDTELFKEKILDYVKKDEENIEKLYRNLQLVLGLTYLQVPFGAMKGIMQYNFRYIDEDVFGKAYETFLSEVRKEEGVYYTPKYITQYIAENTVGKVFDEVLAKIKKKLEEEEFEDVKKLVSRFTCIRILDPACGSGSFLIKAIRIIWKKYKELVQLIEVYTKKYANYAGTLDLPLEYRAKLELLSEIREIIGPKNDRELISRILVRHIHGVDLDKRALEVAKLNIWLEAIKLAPKEFRYDRLPSDTNYVLPNLEMNLCNGDSLVGLPEEFAMNCLHDKYRNDLIKLCNLRQKYLENPMTPELIEEIEDIKRKIRNALDENFKEYLETKGVPTQIINQTKPFHWPLEFWFNYFEKGELLPSNSTGFDVIIGNPPYGRIKQLIKEKNIKKIYTKYYKATYLHQRGNYNYYKLFIERCFYLLKESGLFSMIFPTAFLGELDSQPLRKLLFENAEILRILQFPERTKVFEDVTQDVMVLVYAKNKKRDYSFEIRTNITREELERLEWLDFLELKVSEIKEISGEDYRIPIFSKPKEEWEILRKISTFPPFKGKGPVPPVGEIGEGHLHETFDKEFLSEKPTGNLVVKGIHLDQYFVNLDPDGPQPRWVRKEAFLNKKPVARNNINYLRIIGRNTLNRQIRPRLRFTILPSGYIITNAIKYIIRKDESLDYAYIVGLLNSSLLNWRFELFSSQNNIRNYEIENLPFVRAEANLQSKISEDVSKIIELKKARYYWLKLWKEWQIKLKTDEISLYELLSEDAKFMKTGEFIKTWSSKATFYPNGGQAIINKKFKKFRLIGDPEKKILRIYGLDENNMDELIYEIEFKNGDLMSHIYSSLLQALESRAKIQTLSQLFAKTMVPLIKEVNRSPNELTANIVRKVKDEFEKWLKEEKIEGIEADIVKIDNQIEDIKAEIDASVFKLYGLNEDEIKIVFDSLKTPTIYQMKVLDFFREL